MTLADEHWNERTDHLGLGLTLPGLLASPPLHVALRVIINMSCPLYTKRTLLPFKGKIF